MKQVTLIISLFLLTSFYMFGQNEEVKVYDPQADAAADVKNALDKAAKENKNVLIMLGGNWCPWCIKLNKYIHADAEIDSLINADYVWIKVNYSKENKNPELLKEWGNPQRFGFPVLLVLDKNGKRLHTQDSGLLEEDKSYDRKKLTGFLRNWNVSAVNGSL